jgi:hypothetical protein
VWGVHLVGDAEHLLVPAGTGFQIGDGESDGVKRMLDNRKQATGIGSGDPEIDSDPSPQGHRSTIAGNYDAPWWWWWCVHVTFPFTQW